MSESDYSGSTNFKFANGRFQSDLINLTGVFATATAIALATSGGEDFTYWLYVLAGVGIFLCVVASVLAWIAWRSKETPDSARRKLRIAFIFAVFEFLLFLICLLAAIGISDATGTPGPVYVVLGAALLLVVIQFFSDYLSISKTDENLVDDILPREQPPSLLTRLSVWWTELPGLLLALLIAGGLVLAMLRLAEIVSPASTPDWGTLLGASAWGVLETWTLALLWFKRDVPRIDYAGLAGESPSKLELAARSARSVLILLAMLLFIYSAFISSEYQLGHLSWVLHLALALAAIATVLGMILAGFSLWLKREATIANKDSVTRNPLAQTQLDEQAQRARMRQRHQDKINARNAIAAKVLLYQNQATAKSGERRFSTHANSSKIIQPKSPGWFENLLLRAKPNHNNPRICIMPGAFGRTSRLVDRPREFLFALLCLFIFYCTSF